MGNDDDSSCVEHLWRLTGLHLSVVRGVEQEETCTRCGTVRYATDDLRNDPARPKLSSRRAREIDDGRARPDP